jgi:hypothetical protein
MEVGKIILQSWEQGKQPARGGTFSIRPVMPREYALCQGSTIPWPGKTIIGPALFVGLIEMVQFATDRFASIRARLPWVPILCFIAVGSIGASLFLSSQHFSRLALESYKPVEISSLYTEATSHSPSTVADVVSLLEPANLIERRYDLPIVQSDDPIEVLNAYRTGRVMDCAGMSLSAITVLQQNGISARLWNLTGTDGFGGNGHNVIEYYNQSANRWEMLDPNYSCYFVSKGSKKVLNVAELRQALLTNPQSVDVRYYRSAVELRSPESLIEEFASLAPTASLHATTDFQQRFDERYASLTPFAGLLDKLPISAKRGVRSFLMGDADTKLLIVDGFTPEYQLSTYKMLWHLAISLLLVGLLTAAVRILVRPRVRRSSFISILTSRFAAARARIAKA